MYGAPKRPPTPEGSGKKNYDELVAYQFTNRKLVIAAWGAVLACYVTFRVVPRQWNPTSFRQKVFSSRYDELERRHHRQAMSNLRAGGKAAGY